MDNGTARVIKKDLVKLTGPSPAGAAPRQSPTAGPQARIVEQSDGKSVVEVTCTCCRKIYIQCNY
jgi:cytochrome c5